MSVVNITSIKTSSSGIWQGDNPLNYGFPLLIVQTTLVLSLSRFLSFLFKPLRQPKVLAEITSGILLGPSAFGRNANYLHRIFPSWSTPILESVSSIGLLFFLFLVGLELDLTSIRRGGKRAFAIAAAGVSVPFISGVGISFVLRKAVEGASRVGYVQFVVFIGVSLSITAFPVLARILAELKLLTTRVGETAMAAAAFNDVVAWILLALAIALAGNGGKGPHKSPLVSVWVLLSGVAFVTFMMVAIRPAMKWVTRRCSPDQVTVNEAFICLTLVGVMVSGFMTDLIGVHAIFGGFVFGLMIPKGDFAEKLIVRIEDFVSGLLLPLYFASSGLKTNVAKIHGVEAWGLLVLVITTACAGKIFGTFVVAMLHRVPAREAITLGVLMNTKGLVELIVLNIGKEKKVLDDEVFAILVLMALFTTFMTTPTVEAIYKPAARPVSAPSSPSTTRRFHSTSLKNTKKDELRLLACVRGPGNIPSLVNLIESTRSTTNSHLKLYLMHLVELTERSSSIVMVLRARKNGFPFINRHRNRGELHDRVAVAFQAYSQLGRVTVRPTTAISSLSTMYKDICHVAVDKRVDVIILPFHKQWRKLDGNDGDEVVEEEVENVAHEWRAVNQRVLKEAPCSVAVLVDRGFGRDQTTGPTATVAQRVCILFFGGPNDREALGLGGRMAEHPAVKVTVLRFVGEERLEGSGVALQPPLNKGSGTSYSFSSPDMDHETEKILDEKATTEFRSKWDGVVEYGERAAGNIVDTVLAIGQSKDYNLIVVGNGRFSTTTVAALADRQPEHTELGPIGDLLATSGQGIVSSVLVIQQHNLGQAEESPVSKDGLITSRGSSSLETRDNIV
ncbi:hypothetical protein Vadar_000445 [Vaccinium darrowii]|uniref:Uncharacterized protein n=1 Tax=Vaccinium darrowii TaxID=229202 RepID=A0ACB7ZIL9_9ERIC|nr:hypothetical protein Vadar_000445 [Vaccinium darrowii]